MGLAVDLHLNLIITASLSLGSSHNQPLICYPNEISPENCFGRNVILDIPCCARAAGRRQDDEKTADSKTVAKDKLQGDKLSAGKTTPKAPPAKAVKATTQEGM